MRSATLLAVLVILLGLTLPIGVTFGEQAPPGPSRILQSKFETVTPAAPFDFVVQVFEWEPGGWNPVHTHPSGSQYMVLEGELTNIRIVDGQKTEPVTYRAGDTIVEAAWDIHEFGNLGAVRTRFLSPRLQPKHAPVSIRLPMESFRPGAPPSRIVYGASTEVINVSGPVDLYETWLEWPPGARGAAHFHPGVKLGIVTEGQLTITTATGTTTVSAGESFVNGVGEIHAIANATSEKASVLQTYLIASGRPLTFAAE